MKIEIQAAYGSGKDIHVYKQAGVPPFAIFKVGMGGPTLPGSSTKKNRLGPVGYINLEEGYAQHLHNLHSGNIEIALKTANNPEFAILTSSTGEQVKNFDFNSNYPANFKSLVQQKSR